jgi:hypothetical protein
MRIGVVLLWMLCSFALAQGLSGEYALNADGQTMRLQLRDAGGQLTGTLSGSSGTFQLQGRSSGLEAEAILSDGQERLYVYLKREGAQLRVIVMEFDANDQPDQSTAQEYVFTAQIQASTANPPATKPNPAPALPSATAPRATRTAEWRNGAKFAPGTRVTAKAHGVAFVVPAGFNAQAQSGAAILGNGKGIGALILPFYGASSTDVAALMSRPLEVTGDVALKPVSAITSGRNRLTLRYAADTPRGRVIAVGVAVLGQNSGAAVFAFSDGTQGKAVDSLAASLAAGVTFSASTLATPLQQARAALGGKYLNIFSYSSLPGGTYTGASDRSSSRTWNLCSDGRYTYQGSTEGRYTLLTPGGAGAPDRTGVASGSNGASGGRWRLIVVGEQFLLLLYPADGGVDDYAVTNLERRGGKLPFVDGQELSSFGQNSVCR